MAAATEVDLRTRLQEWIPRIVLAPSVAVILLFVYGFILFTVYLSFTNSKMLPNDRLGRAGQLRAALELPVWYTAIGNLAIFATLYNRDLHACGPGPCDLPRPEDPRRGHVAADLPHPMALSFIVTGTAWKWFLDPGIGLEKDDASLGWESFSFTWIKDNEMAIYTRSSSPRSGRRAAS